MSCVEMCRQGKRGLPQPTSISSLLLPICQQQRQGKQEKTASKILTKCACDIPILELELPTPWCVKKKVRGEKNGVWNVGLVGPRSGKTIMNGMRQREKHLIMQ